METEIEKKCQTVEEFVAEKLHLTLEEFMDKDRKHILKTDLPVKLKVQPPHHYTVEVSTLVKAGNCIRVLGFGTFGMQPIGYLNTVLIELFDTPIVLKPLECDLETLAKALI